MTGGGEETKNLFGLVGTKQRQIDNRPMQAYPRAQAYAGLRRPTIEPWETNAE